MVEGKKENIVLVCLIKDFAFVTKV